MTIQKSIIFAALIIAGAWLIRSDVPRAKNTPVNTESVSVLPPVGDVLTIPLPNFGEKLVSVGVLDRDAFLGLYSGADRIEAERLLASEAPIVMHGGNAHIVLNMLWGLGLAQKSAILEQGMMSDPRFGGADRFASTGGWTIARGDPMEHYSHHRFMALTAEQERLVSRVASGVYRPCCDNGTHFPDCNHGMAMLGLLELLASTDASEDELYRAALITNRLWFPDQYAVLDEYRAFMRGKGVTLTDKELVGKKLISGSGFARLSAERESWGVPKTREQRGGGGCSV